MQFQGKALRHELKYLINYQQYHILRNRIKSIIPHDENAEGGEYHIRSLYFDDVYNSALYEKESGIMRRKKFRIRIYNLSEHIIKLELKEKFGEYISKTSASLTPQQTQQLIDGRDYDFLLGSANQTMKEMYIAMKTRLLRPAVIVDYVREPFALNEGNVRITFDKCIQAGINSFDIFSRDVVVQNVLSPPMLVMEVKYDDFLPSIAKNLVQAHAHQRSAVSKYVMCRRHQAMHQTKIIL